MKSTGEYHSVYREIKKNKKDVKCVNAPVLAIEICRPFSIKFCHGVGAALGPRVAEAEAAAYDFGSLVAPKRKQRIELLDDLWFVYVYIV